MLMTVAPVPQIPPFDRGLRLLKFKEGDELDRAPFAPKVGVPKIGTCRIRDELTR